MKALLALAACTLLISCGSTGGAKTAAEVGTVEPTVELLQLIGPEQLNWESGVIEMKYALRVLNNAAEPIKLRQIQIRTIGETGPYAIPASTYFFQESIPPGAERDIVFFAKAASNGDKYGIDAQSPISVRTTAHFEAPQGNFRTTQTVNLGQSFKNDNR